MLIFYVTVEEKCNSSGAVAGAVVDVTCHPPGEKNEDDCIDDPEAANGYHYTGPDFAPINIFGKLFQPSPENYDAKGNFVMKLEPGEIEYFEKDKLFLCCHCKQQYVTLKNLLTHFNAKHANEAKQYVDKVTNSLRIINE